MIHIMMLCLCVCADNNWVQFRVIENVIHNVIPWIFTWSSYMMKHLMMLCLCACANNNWVQFTSEEMKSRRQRIIVPLSHLPSKETLFCAFLFKRNFILSFSHEKNKVSHINMFEILKVSCCTKIAFSISLKAQKVTEQYFLCMSCCGAF